MTPAVYDPKIAPLVVDVQNDFADPQAPLYVGGAETIVPRIHEEIDRSLEGGATVVYAQDWHPARQRARPVRHAL
jgi:nicotinamidase-related amidase